MGVAELAKGIQYEDPIKTRYNYAQHTLYSTLEIRSKFMYAFVYIHVYMYCMHI